MGRERIETGGKGRGGGEEEGSGERGGERRMYLLGGKF